MMTRGDKDILAVVCRDITTVAGGAPIFLAKSEEESAKIAGSLSRILDAPVHDLENGTYIIVSI